MICGKVTGQVWSTKHIDTLPNGALLEVEVDGKSLIAFDPLMCKRRNRSYYSGVCCSRIF